MNHITLITAFRQGAVFEGGNCASIALIKAAMNKYGDEVFAAHHVTDETHHVTLRDGAELTFTDAQVRIAAQRANFHLRRGRDAAQDALHEGILAKANVYFCAMVMRVMQIGESGEGTDDFEDAIVALNDGADTDDIPQLLGLDYEVAKRWTSTKAREGGIAWSRRHAVFAADGVFDDYGTVRRLGAKYAWRLFLV